MQAKLVTPAPPPAGETRVFYLTPAQFAVSNVALKRIKVARFSDLNDPFELLSVDRSNLKYRSALRKRTKEIDEELGLLCFSKNWANPVLWGHCAEKHAGICMGFDVPEKELHDVIYAKSLREVQLDPKTKRPTLSDDDIDRLK